MRQTTRSLTTAGAVLAVATMAGCALPAHNNTLIFAVKRDFGASVSTPSAADPELSLTLGYKERQAAWVPLWVNESTGGLGLNAKEAKKCNVQIKTTSDGVPKAGLPSIEEISCKKGPKLIADGTPNSDHAKGNDTNDAYSTFASFGGDVNVGKNEGTSGRMALASFFATGVAAQNLSKNANGLVNTASTDGDKNDSKATISPALRLAQAEVLALLESFSPQDTVNDPKATTKACLTKLGQEFAPKKPEQFEWLTGMPPKDAAERWAKASTFIDDEHRKLIGVAYTLRKDVNKEVTQAVDTVMQANASAKSDDEIKKAREDANKKRTETIEKFCTPKATVASGSTT